MNRAMPFVLAVCGAASVAAAGTERLVYIGIDPSSSAHFPGQPQAGPLIGNAAKWAGGSSDPKVAYVEEPAGGGFGGSGVLGSALASQGLTKLTKIDAYSLAGTDLSGFDVLYIGATTITDYLGGGMAAKVKAFVDSGKGLVVEPEVFGSESWTWVPFADKIGHSGSINVGGESVKIVDTAHPVMSGLTGSGLSNWGYSVHSNFSSPEAGGFTRLTNDQGTGFGHIIAYEAIPAPGTIALAGLAGLAAARRRR